MKVQFNNIKEFIKVRDQCVFCGKSLQACLTNYSGIHRNGYPILNTPINSDIITFKFNKTTANFDIKTTGILNIVSNNLQFDVYKSQTPMLDKLVAKNAFEQTYPLIQLYCTNKRCHSDYYISSAVLKIDEWTIYSPKVHLEGFKTLSSIIQNDWITE